MKHKQRHTKQDKENGKYMPTGQTVSLVDEQDVNRRAGGIGTEKLR